MNKLMFSVFAFVSFVVFSACSSSAPMQDTDAMHAKSMKKPTNIDKNNVGITSNEQADQLDPTIIEGNLENNDFKN